MIPAENRPVVLIRYHRWFMFLLLLCVKVHVVDPRFVDDVQFICLIAKIQINRLDEVQFRCSINSNR